MKDLPVKKLILFFLIISLTVSACEAQKYKRNMRNPERELFGKSLNNKTVKYKEAPSIVRAKKKQAKNMKKLDKEYKAYVKKGKERALKIQSPEVKDRIINDRKETDLKYKEKKKRNNQETKKAGNKYK
jgi:hypothetical protein